MKSQFCVTISLLFLIAFNQSLHADGTLYVQSVRAKLFQDATFKSQLIKNISKGSELNVIENKGRWVKVQFHGDIGWVSKLTLSEDPPIAKESLIGENDAKLKKMARRRASSTNTAAATRGLQNETRKRSNTNTPSDYEALKKMEAQKVDDKQVLEFHKQGAQENSR